MTSTHIESALRSSGFRATKPRTAVYAALQRSSSPLSVEHIADLIGSRTANRVTVYRILEAFEKAHLVRSVDLHRGHALYELFDEHDHHHIVCTGCGTIEDFEGCGIETVAKQALRKSSSFSSVTDHSFELFGICNKCTA